MSYIVTPQVLEESIEKNILYSSDGIAVKLSTGDYKLLTTYLNELKDTYSLVNHNHSISDIVNFPTSMPASDVYDWAKSSTKPIYTASEVGADSEGSAATALEDAKSYCDTKISDLIGSGTPETLDTLKEIADAIQSSSEALEVLNNAIANKANNSDLTSHINDTVKHISSTERTNWTDAYTHSTSAHAPINAQVNTIESISVNGTTIAIDNKNVNITVPTKLSQLSNDKEYLTQSDLTKISITKSQITDFPTSMPASDVYDWAKASTKPSYSFDEITGDINKDVNGNATSATKVYGTLTNPTSSTSYYIPFHSGASSGNKSLLNNNGILYQTLEGTTSVNGYGVLELGNGTASGTAGNKYGVLKLYGKGANYTILEAPNSTVYRRIISLPDADGTVALTSSNVASATALTSSAGSAIQPVYFSDGKPVACTYSLDKPIPTFTLDGTTLTITTNNS